MSNTMGYINNSICENFCYRRIMFFFLFYKNVSMNQSRCFFYIYFFLSIDRHSKYDIVNETPPIFK